MVWLWLTVLFANFAEAVAEGRGKAQAATLRRARTETMAKRLATLDAATFEMVGGAGLKQGDIVLVEAGELIPSDGEVSKASRRSTSSAITGEFGARHPRKRRRPVRRHRRHARAVGLDQGAHHRGAGLDLPRPHDRAGGRRGTAEDAERDRAEHPARRPDDHLRLRRGDDPELRDLRRRRVSVVMLVALFVALIPTTIGALLSAIGIAGMDRLVRFNVLAMSGRAVEAAGDVDTLLLDKTGTITLGNRQATEFFPVTGVTRDGTGGRGATRLAAGRNAGGPLDRRAGEGEIRHPRPRDGADGRAFHSVLGADAAVRHRLRRLLDPQGRGRRGAGLGRATPSADGDGRRRDAPGVSDAAVRELTALAEEIAKAGGTPLAVAKDGRLLGVIYLKDIVKGGIRERFNELRRMGIRTVMITGDNPLTAAAIAAEAGVDDFLAQATPEAKLQADPRRAGAGQAGGDVRRRHQRRAGAGAGRCRRGDEHRHDGGARGRQHGRPGQRSDQADRDRRDRQAVADDARRADDVLHRQRRGEVLRHDPGDVHRVLSAARRR